MREESACPEGTEEEWALDPRRPREAWGIFEGRAREAELESSAQGDIL